MRRKSAVNTQKAIVRLQDLLHEVTKLLYEVTPRADRSNGAQRARAGPGARPRVRPGSRARWSAVVVTMERPEGLLVKLR